METLEAHGSQEANGGVGKTKYSLVPIIRKVSRAKSCGTEYSGDQRRKQYVLSISESRRETIE